MASHKGVTATGSQGTASNSNAVAASSYMSNSNLRRNLFSQHLLRRPTGTSSSSAKTASDTLHFLPSETDNVIVHEEDTDILVHDERGELTADQITILAAIEQEALSKEEGEDGGTGDKLHTRLIDVWQTRTRSGIVEPAELKTALFTNLRDKVASLDKDRWMYEPEMEGETQS